MTKFKCGVCGNPVGYWFYGWKHQTGGNSKRPSCSKARHVIEIGDEMSPEEKLLRAILNDGP